MSVCTFIASDYPLRTHVPSRDYPLEINIDDGIIFDGDADDNFFLNPFLCAGDYCGREFCVSLEWNYSDGRANQIIAYIKSVLLHTESIEIWHVWLEDYFEFEDRPFIHRKTISMKELTTAHIRDIHTAAIWNTPDKIYPNRPSFYCLTITK